MQVEQLIGRSTSIFETDLENLRATLSKLVQNSRFLVVGAGTIGQAVAWKFSNAHLVLHVVDISENNLVGPA